MSQHAPHFPFHSRWRVPHACAAVWEALADPLSWPQWWPGCRQVDLLGDCSPGTAQVGHCYRFHWHGRLVRYTLVITVRLTHFEAQKRLAGTVTGRLNGTAQWQLKSCGNEAEVDFHFDVSAPSPWLGYLAVPLRPLFRRQFHQLMHQGEAGLNTWLTQRSGRQTTT